MSEWTNPYYTKEEWDDICRLEQERDSAPWSDPMPDHPRFKNPELYPPLSELIPTIAEADAVPEEDIDKIMTLSGKYGFEKIKAILELKHDIDLDMLETALELDSRGTFVT